MYLDANNLYGWAMVQHLPTSGFKWSSTDNKSILEHPDEHQTGYICEVDLSILMSFMMSIMIILLLLKNLKFNQNGYLSISKN